MRGERASVFTNRARGALACVVLVCCAPVARSSASDAFPPVAGLQIESSAHELSEIVGPGVTYDRWSLVTVPGPLSISILTIDLTNPLVSLSAVAANGEIGGPGARLSVMADAVHAEAGINSDYFDINGSGAPLNSLVVGGQYLHAPDGAATFSVDSSGKIAIGPMAWSAHVQPIRGAALTINTVNDWSASTPLTLLTAQLGSDLGYGAAEVVLTPTASGAYAVRSIATNLTNLTPLRPSEIAIAAHGVQSAGLQQNFTVGDTVGVTYEGTPSPASIAMAIGGGPQLLRAGLPYADPVAPAPQEADVRYPLTGAGVSTDGRTLWLVVVDGRHPGFSIGVTRAMLGQLFATLGASDAMAFDSGGSSEMVVRGLGDPTVHVATAPSDGRERSIADGIAVINTATPGPAVRLSVSAADPAVLVGSRDQLTVRAVDTNLQPVAVADGCAGVSASPAGAATVDAACVLTANATGAVSVAATDGQASGQLSMDVVADLAAVNITGFEPDIPIGSTVQLTVSAMDSNSEQTAVDASAVTWTVTGDAHIDPAGRLTAGARPSVVRVGATVGGIHAYSDVDVGDHVSMLAPDLPAGDLPQAWSFVASSSLVTGSVADSSAPDGSIATRLIYGIASGSGVRAAYADGSIAISGEPLALTCDVYGDGQGEWLRAAYVEPGGIVDTVTLARHVDWLGWRSLRVALPEQARTSLTLTRMYIAQPAADEITGSIWLRNIGAVYPGP